jgi:hypothetical protein
VKWANQPEPTVITNVFDVTASQLSTEVVPPSAAIAPSASRCGGPQATGLLLAYVATGAQPDPSTDELVGVSFKQPGIFSTNQTLLNDTFTWNTCQEERFQVPLVLQHDPRLRFALCEVVDGKACGQPVFDRTRVVDASVGLDGERVSLFLNSLLGPTNEGVTVEVNGSPLAGLFVSASFAQATTTGLGPWHAGANTVRVTIGQLAPWQAEVELPSKPLDLVVSTPTLSPGGTLSARWNAPWATFTQVVVTPQNDPTTKTNFFSFTSTSQTLTEVFPGFAPAASGAAIQVFVFRRQGSMTVWTTERLEVPVGEGP